MRLTPEQIVRLLAKCHAPVENETGRCLLCDGGYDEPGHKPDCPHQLAVQWVAEQTSPAPFGPGELVAGLISFTPGSVVASEWRARDEPPSNR